MSFYAPLPHHHNIQVLVRRENGDAILVEKDGRSVITLTEWPCPVRDFATLVRFGLEQWQAAQTRDDCVPQQAGLQ